MKDMYEEAADEGPTFDQLKLVGELATKQIKFERAVEDAEAALKKAKKDLSHIQDKELPEAMEAAGCQAFTTTDGHKITIKKDISASLSDGKKPAAIEWLRANNHESIISTNVVVPFSAGDEEKVIEVVEMLRDANVLFTSKEDVNTATLKSLIRELRENGVDVPLETLGAYEWKKAIIK